MKHINLKLKKDQKNLYLYFSNQELDPFWKIGFSHEFNTAAGLLILWLEPCEIRQDYLTVFFLY